MYSKVFPKMYQGTLASTGPWQALVTFQQLICLADKNGVVDMTREAIARISTVPLEIITVGIDALEQPDPGSRSQIEDGRRIVRLDAHRDWGWVLVNYAHYRDIRSADDRREYNREYIKQKRTESAEDFDKCRLNVEVGTNAPHTQTHNQKNHSTKPLVPYPGFEGFWKAYPSHARKVNKQGCQAKWKIKELEHRFDEVISGLAAWVKHWARDDNKFVLLPLTFLNQDRWLTPPRNGDIPPRFADQFKGAIE